MCDWPADWRDYPSNLPFSTLNLNCPTRIIPMFEVGVSREIVSNYY